MQGRLTSAAVCGWLLVVLGFPLHAAPLDCRPSTESVCRAIKLLPRPPVRVVVLDADGPPTGPPSRRSHSDAFVTTADAFVTTAGDGVVYVRRQGTAFQQSQQRHPFSDHVLAIVIWHEMAHLEGADEPTAQRAEEELWRNFVLRREVEAAPGMQYLALLRKRRE